MLARVVYEWVYRFHVVGYAQVFHQWGSYGKGQCLVQKHRQKFVCVWYQSSHVLVR